MALTSGVAGNAFIVDNAQLGTTYAINVARAEDLIIGSYAAATGTADTVALSVSGAGLKATAVDRAGFDVAGGNAVEAVTLSTSGTNYVDLAAGTGTKTITVTGNGTNDLAITESNTALKLDASATTGTNRFDMVLGLSSTDTVLGGSGVDTLVANLTPALQYIPTVAGVENLELAFGAASTYNGSKTVGVEQITLSQVAVSATFSNLTQTADTINIGTDAAIAAGGAVKIGYAAKSDSDVVVNVGATSTTSNPAVSVTGLTVTGNAGALTVNSVGDAANSVGAVTANAADALSLVGVAQKLTTGAIEAGNAATVTVDGTLKEVSAGGTLTIDESTTALNVTSGAGAAAITGVTTLTAAAAAGLTTTITAAGSKNASIAGLDIIGTTKFDIASDVVLNGDGKGTLATGNLFYNNAGTAVIGVTDSLTINGGAGAVTVGTTVSKSDSVASNHTLTINGGEAAVNVGTTDQTAATKGALTANYDITTGAGAVGVAAITATGNAATAQTVTFTGVAEGAGALTATKLTSTASKTGSTVLVDLAAIGAAATLTELAVAGAGLNTATLALEAASGQTVAIGTLSGNGDIGSITAIGAGNVDIGQGGSTNTNAADTVIEARGLTGQLRADLNNSGATADISVFLGNAASGLTNVVKTGAGNDVVYGGSGADTAELGSGSDYAEMGAGVDSVLGGAGNDSIHGGDGDDTLKGEADTDFLYGDAGADAITGGLAADLMSGGSGADSFVYANLAAVALDTGITLLTSDIITDFVSGVDTIKTGDAGTVANYAEAAAVDFAAALVAANAAFAATPALKYYLTSSTADGVGLLFVDTVAGVAADAVIQLSGISASNFAYTDIVA